MVIARPPYMYNCMVLEASDQSSLTTTAAYPTGSSAAVEEALRDYQKQVLVRLKTIRGTAERLQSILLIMRRRSRITRITP